MGAGYYDRFLATASKSIFMGVTYDCLLDKRVPSDRYDKKMHYIVTETKLIHCK